MNSNTIKYIQYGKHIKQILRDSKEEYVDVNIILDKVGMSLNEFNCISKKRLEFNDDNTKIRIKPIKQKLVSNNKTYEIKYCPKEIQNFDPKLINSNDIEVMRCYNHFKDRYKERLGNDLSYNSYWEVWICYLKGYCVGIHNNRMDRAFGNYLKDECLFKVIYVKVHLGIYVPLTIIKIDDRKKKVCLYRKIIEMKKGQI
jgi:hypothetical protein